MNIFGLPRTTRTCVVALLLASCAAPPLKLYTLDAPAIATDSRPLGGRAAVIQIQRVTLPDYLDTQDILVRRGKHARPQQPRPLGQPPVARQSPICWPPAWPSAARMCWSPTSRRRRRRPTGSWSISAGWTYGRRRRHGGGRLADRAQQCGLPIRRDRGGFSARGAVTQTRTW